MRTLNISGKFKKSMKKVRSDKKFKQAKYDEVIDCLLNNKPLARIYDDHPAAKTSFPEIQGMRILHLAPDLCLIYKLSPDTLYLYNIGSHSHTGLTEKLI